ncbi:MAG: methanethiol S-methyltransferase [Ktedonobacterales bacterium]
MGAVLALIYGAACYIVFLVAVLYSIGFVENMVVPTTLDGRQSSPLPVALAVDIALLALFAMQHSIMARPRFKAWWTSIIPHTIERSTFVLLTSLILLLLFWQWRPIDAIIWHADNAIAYAALLTLSFFGWLLALTSTFLINHFDLFGLRQVYLAWRRQPYTNQPFRVVGLYRLVRHPLMLGFVIAFWATARMTAGHLLFAVATTAYILLAVHFLEERDLVATLGDPYTAYRRRVPMLLPLPLPRPRKP